MACWWGTRPSVAEDSSKGGALPGWLVAGVRGGWGWARRGEGPGQAEGRRDTPGPALASAPGDPPAVKPPGRSCRCRSPTAPSPPSASLGSHLGHHRARMRWPLGSCWAPAPLSTGSPLQLSGSALPLHQQQTTGQGPLHPPPHPQGLWRSRDCGDWAARCPQKQTCLGCRRPRRPNARPPLCGLAETARLVMVGGGGSHMVPDGSLGSGAHI